MPLFNPALAASGCRITVTGIGHGGNTATTAQINGVNEC